MEGSAPRNAVPPPYTGGQVATGSRLGLLGNTGVMDSPFSTSSYTDRWISDRQAATVTEALALDPSVRTATNPGGQVDSLFIRGFPVGEGNSGEIAFDGQYGIAPNYRVFTEFVERIEVLRGPGALLYGMSPNSGIGGVINIVPKRAEEDLTRLTLNYASASQFGGHLDLARRFGDQRQWGLRFNGSYRQGDTDLDKQRREAFVGALALDYRGERFRASLDFFRQQDTLDAPLRPVLLAPGVRLPSAPNGRRNLSQPWEWSRVTDDGALLRAEYDLTDSITVFGNLGGSQTEVRRLFSLPTIVNALGDTTSTPGNATFRIERYSASGGARARIATGPIGHMVTLQADAYHEQQDRLIVNGTAYRSNIYQPVLRSEQAVPAPGRVPRVSTTALTGLSLADTIAMFDERLRLMLGLRLQRVESNNYNATTGGRSSAYDESAVTPFVGLVVRPWAGISLYANYIEGLSRGDIAPTTAANAGEAFAPYRAQQYEAGVKFDLRRAIVTLSAFQITRPTAELSNNIYSVGGEQRVRGLELTSSGEITPSLRLLGGLTLFDAEITRSGTAAVVGNRPIGVPTYQTNLGLDWDLPWTPGLSLNGAVVLTGRQQVDTTNTVSLPAWARLDIGARYRAEIAGRPTTFRASILNVTDNDHWAGVASFGTISQGAPRTFLFSVTADL
ncbi:TonB-dependent siderophore receptor [Belnapia sp. T18]|uniref:TonB-dependent siderophore receptor n=1 Tax=Belnapia arida TaxID=2804533 RepID=A0ABS1UCF9_9PROT|nr:TonB-dependent siderophore receptor [Belnapia arida]MBL6082343.1 TonB-dependent siderophore receptor [Belnapia arida]